MRVLKETQEGMMGLMGAMLGVVMRSGGVGISGAYRHTNHFRRYQYTLQHDAELP